MNELSERIASLSPERRRLLERRLRKEGMGAPKAPPIPPRPRREFYPLSFGQQRLWLIDQLAPGTPAYNIPFAGRLKGALDARVLERSINEIVRRQEALRTVFRTVDDRPVQAVLPELSLALPLVDLRGLEASEREKEDERLVSEEARIPFDLSRAPLVRVKLLRLGDEEHTLLVTMPHIITDAWSMGVFFRELPVIYDALSGGGRPALPELPVQCADYAVWQREHLSDEALAEQLAYWKRELAGAPTVLDLPTDRQRPPVQTGNGVRHAVDIPAEVARALNALSQHEGVTLFMTLLAAFNALLNRYTGQEDILVGSPVATRGQAETQGLIGFFINTLVLRTRLHGDPTFRGLLARVRETCLGAYAHQDAPFEKLVELMGVERDPSRQPLVQATFVLQNVHIPPPAFRGLTLESFQQTDTRTAKVDLTLGLWETGEGVEGWFEYDTDLFEPETIARMSRHLRRLLEAVVADPDRRLSDLPLLTGAERHQLLTEWNNTATGHNDDETIQRLFEEQAEKTPDRVAVLFEGQQLTYGELNRRANQLAHYLRRLGVRPEVPVGVCIERSPAMVMALLAVLKAGGAYVPLDPAYPKERLGFMLEDSRAPVLLTTSPLKETFAGYGAQAVCVDVDREEIARSGGENPTAETGPDNAAYVIYTSGSTGKPKGVVGLHRGAVNRFRWMWDRYPFAAGEICCQKTALSFVDSVWEVFGPLLQGVPLLIIPDEALKDTGRLIETLASGRVTRIVLVPSLLRALLDALRDLKTGLPRLRSWISSGEVLTPELCERLREIMPESVLLNLYGSSEVAADCTWHELSTGAAIRSVPIGQPIDNTRVYLLDRQLQLVPVGVTGEVYVGGDCLARGYFGRPRLTAEKFVPDPFSRRPGGRLFKTGDLACYRPDGIIEYLGRADHQVKIRGFRIELGEIETALACHPSVREAVVAAREDAPGDKRLAAYVVAGAGHPTTAASLREYLRGNLPDYMVPSAFVFLDALPLTPNKKVNRLALPPPDVSGGGTERVVAQPRTPVEEVLAAVFAEVLHLERVGIHDNFLELGGHSLLATQAVSRVRSSFKVELPLRALFQSPTPASLAQAVTRALLLDQDQPPPILPVGKDSPLPLSFAQQRLWFLDQIEPANPAYNISAAARVFGALDLEAFRRCIDETVRRHDSVRTRFPSVDGEPRQVVVDSVTMDIPVIDLRGLPHDDRRREAIRLAEEESRRGFDLRQAPPVRARLVALAETEHILIVTMHHIISDGWSMGVMVRELAALYEAFTSGGPSPLPALEIQYADYAAWQRGWLRGETLERQLGYWRRQLAGAPTALNLRADRPRPAVQSNRGARHGLTIDKAVAGELKRLGRAEGATLFMALLGAFNVLLSRYGGQTDILVGTPVANRNRSETENLIGFFVNTLVLRTNLTGDPTFRELLGRVREAALEAYAHQDLPFEKLVSELQPKRDLSRNPVFQVMMVLQNAHLPEMEFAGLRLTPMEIESHAAMFDLTLVLREEEEGLVGSLEYSTDLFDPATVARMVSHFEVLLKGIIADPDQRLSRLPRPRPSTSRPRPWSMPSGSVANAESG